jgi:hypothetical protein
LLTKPYHFVKFYRAHKPGINLHFEWLVRFDHAIVNGADACRLAKMVTNDVQRFIRRYENKVINENRKEMQSLRRA